MRRQEIVMLERYFVFPHTVDRIRAAWIGEPIERYVEHLAEQGYAARTILCRVPLLVQFGEFARAQGAKTFEELPAYAEDLFAGGLGNTAQAGAAARPVRGSQ